MRYVLMGDPIALARPRFGRGRVWDCQKQSRVVCTIELQRQHGNQPLFSGPLHLDINFYFSMPKSKPRYWPILRGAFHVYRPDLSNMIKWVEDIANLVLYNDDCVIASIHATKKYDDIPRTEFEITELKRSKK